MFDHCLWVLLSAKLFLTSGDVNRVVDIREGPFAPKLPTPGENPVTIINILQYSKRGSQPQTHQVKSPHRQF